MCVLPSEHLSLSLTNPVSHKPVRAVALQLSVQVSSVQRNPVQVSSEFSVNVRSHVIYIQYLFACEAVAPVHLSRLFSGRV